jgi:hypothetical protein
MINHRGHREHGGMRLKLREFALVRDANGQLVEDGNNRGSGFKTAAKVGLGAAGVAGGAVLGTRYYHANKAVQEAGEPALREFGSSGLARLGRVQEALARIDDSLSLRQGALAKHVGGPGGWASVKASRDSLKQQQRAQLSKFRQKLNQSELRYEQYPPDFHPSFGSGPQIGWGPAFADYPKFPRDKKYNLDANLKPALRELAARSEAITEFAMVRNADGQFVEVEDEGGMSMGAVKAGAGAAALGGAGYGAYRGHNAVMSKFGTFGPMEAGKSRMGEAYKGAGAAGLTAVKGAGATGLNAAKKSGFGTRLRGALLGAARWMK